MIYTNKIKHAIRFSTKTHEVYQKQKRKAKDIPYIVHPLTVGLILARADASEDAVIAGILHDTIEDSIPEKKVTREMIVERFGENVATLVESVTETNKELSWEERKREALGHISKFSNDSVLVKSADVISNMSELIDDHKEEGEVVWDRFNASKEGIIDNAQKVIAALRAQWPTSPLVHDLEEVATGLRSLV